VTGLVVTATAPAGRKAASGGIRATAVSTATAVIRASAGTTVRAGTPTGVVALRASVTPSAAAAGMAAAEKAVSAGKAVVVRGVRSVPEGQGGTVDTRGRPDRGRARRAEVTASVVATGVAVTVTGSTGHAGSPIMPEAAGRPRATNCHGSPTASGRISSRARRARN
jgi:hypothetical protein